MYYQRLALRAALIALFVAGLCAIGVRAAFAATSAVSPSAVGTDTTMLYWSGQGANPVSQQCGQSADPGAGGYQNNATATSYMLWIFTTDGGAASSSPPPTLTINNVTYGNAFATSTSTWQIVTPYIDPSTITPANAKDQSSTGTAYASFTVSDTGSGAWGLKISHGCAGSTASTPMISKTASGSYDNTYTWTLTKNADTATVYSAGGGQSNPVTYTVDVSHDGGTISNVQVTGTITVTNPNSDDPIAITGLTDTLSDTTACTITNVPSSLPPGDTALNYVCDLTALPTGDLTNTAVVSWGNQTLPTDGTLTGGSASFTTPPISFTSTTIDNCITVSDPLDSTGPQQFCVGDTNLSFTYSATFTGPAGTCSTDQNTATGTTNTTGTVVDSNTVTVSDCQGADLIVTKTAVPSYTRTFGWSITKSVDNQEVDTSGSATFNYTVNVSHDSGTDSAFAVSGIITVQNPNDWESISGVDVSDQIDNSGSCTVQPSSGGVDPASATIPASGSVDFPYTCTFASNPGSGTNTATATWDAATYSTPDGAATGTADYTFGAPTTVQGSCTTVSDSVDGGSPLTLGVACIDPVSWTTDPGNSLANFQETYTDPTFTLTYSRTFSGDPAGTCTTHNNTATFITSDTGATDSSSQSVQVCVGADLTVTKAAAASFTRTFGWSITKSVDKHEVNTSGSATFNYTVNVSHDGGTDSAFAASGTITVTNPNDWENISGVNVGDSIDHNGNCTVQQSAGGVDPANATIPESGSVVFPYTCTFGANPGSGTNTGTATWDAATYYTPDGTATGTAPYAFGAPTTVKDRCFTATDSIDGGSPLTLGVACIDPVSWTTDPGNNLANFQESFTDPTFTFTYSRTFSDPAGTCTTHNNTAMFTTGDTGATGNASQSVQVCVGADLKVAKTAAPSFTRTYGWSITKSVDKTKVTIDPWTSATFNYTVKASHNSGTDSAFAVSGTITVTNPNDWENISGVNVSDSIDNNGNCTVQKSSGGVDPAIATIPANGSVVFPYTCTFGSNPGSGTNTAQATWNAATYSTPDAAATGTAPYTFGAPTTVKGRCFTASDSFNGGSPLTLGVACIDPVSWTKDPGNNLANFQESFTDPTFTFTYSRTIHAPGAGTCATYPNTAKFTTSDTGSTGSAGASVQLCSYQAPLTIGYWGNHLDKTGQSDCSGLPNGTGCSNNGPWSKTYLPQPLGGYSVTTVSTVAKVIAANNCGNSSSSSQNAVGCLAAQLLAAELNVGYGSNTCILTVADGINNANTFLSGGIVDGVAGIHYTGPTSTYTLSAAQRNEALVLKNKLVNYNQDGGC